MNVAVMLRDSYLLQIYVLLNTVTISNTFLMMILSVYVTVLSVFFADEKPQFSQMG